MKKYVFSFVFLLLIMLVSGTSQAWAQKPLKGNWIVIVQAPIGTVPVPIAFKAGGKGTITGPGGKIPIAYREKGSSYSVAFEGVGLGANGTDVSIIVRGSKQDTTLDGKVIFISDTPDPSNPLGFSLFVGTAMGKRN